MLVTNGMYCLGEESARQMIATELGYGGYLRDFIFLAHVGAVYYGTWGVVITDALHWPAHLQFSQTHF